MAGSRDAQTITKQLSVEGWRSDGRLKYLFDTHSPRRMRVTDAVLVLVVYDLRSHTRHTYAFCTAAVVAPLT